MPGPEEKTRFGPLRCRALRKPPLEGPEPRFYRCPRCGRVYFPLFSDAPPSASPVAGTAEAGERAPACCGADTQPLPCRAPMEFPDLRLSYEIFGSLNENAVRAFWDCDNWKEKPQWIYLRSFSGGQLKYVAARKRSPLLFALADEDAYAYCDKDPCVECTFRCKRGFGLYYYFRDRGLIYLPLDRMSARQQTENHGVDLDEILRREGRL